MLLGDAAVWADQFISFDERVLERVAHVWPSCIAVLRGQPEEDIITINLVDRLSKDDEVRRLCHWIEYQYEPLGLAADGSGYSKGKIDIAVMFDRERERYLAYECKRLNVVHAGRRSSLAKAYVAQGMIRFIAEQYAEGLPLGFMLGYVMDGDVAAATSRVKAAIMAHTPLMLRSGPDDLRAIQAVRRFQTSHMRVGGMQIEIRHALLSFVAQPACPLAKHWKDQ